MCYLFTETVPTLEKHLGAKNKSQPINLMAITTSGIYSSEDVKALQEISNILPHSYLQKQSHKKWQELLRPTLAVLWNKNLTPSGLLLSRFSNTWGNIPAPMWDSLAKSKAKPQAELRVFEAKRKM